MAITEVDGEQAIAARLSGGPERKIARRLGISLADVRDALDRFSRPSFPTTPACTGWCWISKRSTGKNSPV
jgi:hypothetical protein